MKFVYLICGIFCSFALVFDANAMSSNNLNYPINSQYKNTSHKVTVRRLTEDVQQLKKEVNEKMTKFHRIIQSFESDIFMHTIELRQYFWELEMIVDGRKQSGVMGEKRSFELFWDQWTRGEPLFSSYLDIQRADILFCEKISELIQNTCELKERGTQCKNRTNDNRMFNLKNEVKQFYSVVDEHLSGLHCDINRLESFVKEQMLELYQDIDLLKIKMDEYLSKLYWSSSRMPNSQQFITSWQSLQQHVLQLDTVSSKNMSGIHDWVIRFKEDIYNGISSLCRNAALLQATICGEFSCEYIKSLLIKPRERSKLNISYSFRE